MRSPQRFREHIRRVGPELLCKGSMPVPWMDLRRVELIHRLDLNG